VQTDELNLEEIKNFDRKILNPDSLEVITSA